MGTSTNVTLRLPASLKADGTTLDQFIALAVAAKVAALRTADDLAARAKRADFEEFDRFMSRDTGAPPRRRDLTPSAGAVRGRVVLECKT